LRSSVKGLPSFVDIRLPVGDLDHHHEQPVGRDQGSQRAEQHIAFHECGGVNDQKGARRYWDRAVRAKREQQRLAAYIG
jgi:hypothetical protein